MLQIAFQQKHSEKQEKTPMFEALLVKHLFCITACEGEEVSRFFGRYDSTEGNDFSWPPHKPAVSGKETIGPIFSLD